VSLARWLFVTAVASLVMTHVNAADNATAGVYLGAGCDGVKRMPAYERWLGRKPEQMLDFIPWEALQQNGEWHVRCWKNAGQKRVVFSVPMLPGSGAKLSDGAAGKFDTLFKNFAQQLVKYGYGDSIIRIGWEFNADWYPWAASRDPKSWIEYWRRIVTTMRSVPGANFKFDWNAAETWSWFRAERAYPGDDYVDIIGLDYYNALGENARHLSPQEAWELRKKAPHGLDWHKKFATKHDKPMSYPEWGTGKRKKDNLGGGDDPYFIEKMAEWIASNNVAYHNYWDYSAPIFNARLSDKRMPEAAQAFVQKFGDPKQERRTPSAIE